MPALQTLFSVSDDDNLFETALPVAGLWDALHKLSRHWLKRLDAATAVATAVSHRGDKLLLSLAVGGKEPQGFSCPWIPGEVWEPQEVVDLVFGLPQLRNFRSVDHFSFRGEESGAMPLGGAFAGEPRITISPALAAIHKSASALLVAQGRLIDEQRAAQLAELEAAKFRSLAEFAAGAGHEINNPLAVINGRAQLLLRDETDPERREAISAIGSQALRIRDMIGDLMLLGNPPEPELRPLDLAEVAAEVVEKLRPMAAERNCTLELKSDPASLQADPDQLRVVVSELIRNSINALPAGGAVEITVGENADGERRFASCRVHDRGVGLSDLDREHLFDPFYSARQAGRGLGFGLCKCRRIVELHGGTIQCSSSATAGTTFTARLPVNSGGDDGDEKPA